MGWYQMTGDSMGEKKTEKIQQKTQESNLGSNTLGSMKEDRETEKQMKMIIIKVTQAG
jgi:hypothetical protein